MKKYFILILLLINIIPLNALERFEVKLSSCVDGDTAKFIVDNKIQSTRFLAIDTPESTIEKEEFGDVASDYTCNKLKNAKLIELELDPNSDKYDRYNRLLAWIWVDQALLQKDIISYGYAEVAYLYGDYKYTTELQGAMEIAKNNKVGMWSTSTEENSDFYVWILIIIMVIIIKKLRKRK